MRRKPPERAEVSRPPTIVPPELAIGPCSEVWSEAGGPLDLITARGRYSRARTAWKLAEGLDTRQSCQLLRVGAPWSVTDPRFTDRLARHGLSEADVPHLRTAAQVRAAETYPDRRRS